jgi:hypothetical protein
MKYYHDHEFLENGRTIELISSGFVCEDGREYYAVNADAPWERILSHEWLMNNVVSSLLAEGSVMWEEIPGEPLMMPRLAANRAHPAVKTRTEIRDDVLAFLTSGSYPELWAWYGSYDHVVLAQLFGRMIDLPYEKIPMWTNDLRQEVERLGIYHELPAQPDEGLHNALEDARFLKRRHEFVMQWAETNARV